MKVHTYTCSHSASLLLLVGAFKPFTFKLIINMYDPITILLIVSCLFCVSLFILLCFLTGEVPLAFVIELV